VRAPVPLEPSVPAVTNGGERRNRR
jgi:hypothetical protein